MTYLKTKPYALQRGEGQTLRSLEAIVHVKATAEQANGAFNLFEVTCQQGYATSLDIHYAEDVAVYVLEAHSRSFGVVRKGRRTLARIFTSRAAHRMDFVWKAIRRRGFYI